MPSLFTQIINKELPCHKIFEDEFTLAFLDIRPIAKGHSIIVPKIEVNHFFDVPSPFYEACFNNGKKIAKALKKVTGCQRVGLMVAGFEVPHFHLHMVPANCIADIDFKKANPENPSILDDLRQKIVEEL